MELSAKESDMEKVISEQAAVGKSESDATVHVTEGARIDNGCEDIVHEFCPNEDFNIETGDHVVEKSEVFKMSFSDKGWSKMNENQILKEMELSLDYTFNFCKVKREDRTFKVVKSEKCAETHEVFLKVKNIPDVLKAVGGLKT